MIEVDKRYIHVFGCGTEVEMIETAHFSAFILPFFAKELFFSIFECSPIKKFLILIWSFLGGMGFSLYLLNHFSLFLRKLLKFNIVEFIIVEKFAEDDIKVA